MWAKCVAFLLAVVTGLSTLLFGTGALLVGLVPEFQTDEAGYEKLFYGWKPMRPPSGRISVRQTIRIRWNWMGWMAAISAM